MFKVFNLSLNQGTTPVKKDSLTSCTRVTFCGVPRSILEILYAAKALRKKEMIIVSLIADISKGRVKFSRMETRMPEVREPANSMRLDRLLNTENASALSEEGTLYMRV